MWVLVSKKRPTHVTDACTSGLEACTDVGTHCTRLTGPNLPNVLLVYGHSAQFSALKFAHDGAGGKIVRKINVCATTRARSRETVWLLSRNSIVQPGDVVAATSRYGIYDV